MEKPSEGTISRGIEQIVLAALLRLGEDAYGMTVRRDVENRTGRAVSIGAVYATLEWLENKGFVGSFAGDPTPERGVRAKRFFRIKSDGPRALRESREALNSVLRGLEGRWSTT
jgi:DNA-binding PadR family transcriptional regulator